MRNWLWRLGVGIILVCAVVAIVYYSVLAMGIAIPAVVWNILWVVGIAALAIFALAVLFWLSNWWGGPPGP